MRGVQAEISQETEEMSQTGETNQEKNKIKAGEEAEQQEEQQEEQEQEEQEQEEQEQEEQEQEQEQEEQEQEIEAWLE